MVFGTVEELQQSAVEEAAFSAPVNTRTALWPGRWPAIALQECIDKVEAAPPDQRSVVKFELPCQECEKNTACLNAKRKELGPLLYDREILTSPRSSESSLFPLTVWAPGLQRDESLVPHWRPPFSLEHEYRVCQSWDLAWSEKLGGDYMVGMTAYVHLPTGTRQLLDIVRKRGLSFDAQCKLIEADWQRFQADLVVIEGDAAQKIWRQHMAATTPVPVISHDAGGEKNDLAAGIPGLLITLENRKWRVPYRKGSWKHEEVENMLSEFESLGWVDGNLEGVGEHDDTCMGFWHLNWGIERLLYFSGDTASKRSGNVAGAQE
jgi:phage terminase large subunit-like protein